MLIMLVLLMWKLMRLFIVGIGVSTPPPQKHHPLFLA